jgi:hypothetical protein
MLNKNFLPATIIGLLFLFLLARGCGTSGQQRLSYQDVGVGVGQYSTAQLNGEQLDLTADLDPAQVPEIIKSSYLDGAKLKKEGKELLSFVIQDASQKLASISTIDLNKNNVPDPILLVPEGDEERMTFSIRVPDPSLVTTYPTDAAEWQTIADKKAIEVVAVTVFPRLVGGKLDRFDVEARPSQQLYETSHRNHYQSSFMTGYFTATMMNAMFFNPYRGWYGPGFYGRMGYYSPGYYNSNYGGRTTQSTRTTRTSTSYKKATASNSAMKTNSGKTVSSSLSNKKSSAVSSYKSSAIKTRNASAVKKASGFGSSRPAASSKKSSSSSWGRSSGRSSWGGGGSRGGK